MPKIIIIKGIDMDKNEGEKMLISNIEIWGEKTNLYSTIGQTLTTFSQDDKLQSSLSS